MLQLKQVFVVALAVTVMGGVSACNQSNPQDTARIKELEAENLALKQQLQPTAAPSTAPATTAEATPAPKAFNDVDTDVPTAPTINELAQLKVFEDVGTEFKPLEPIKRGEYIIWLYKAYNAMHPAEKQIRMAPGYKVTFTDIDAKHVAYKYVQAFANAGFSVGYDAKTFKADQPLTREEMIAIKHGVDGGQFYSTTAPHFSDAAQIDKRFLPAVYADEIMDDGPHGSNAMRAFGAVKALKPKEPVLRYEAAGTLWQTDHYGKNTADLALKKES